MASCDVCVGDLLGVGSPRVILGPKAHILVQFCNPNVKPPHFVVTERVVVKEP